MIVSMSEGNVSMLFTKLYLKITSHFELILVSTFSMPLKAPSSFSLIALIFSLLFIHKLSKQLPNEIRKSSRLNKYETINNRSC